MCTLRAREIVLSNCGVTPKVRNGAEGNLNFEHGGTGAFNVGVGLPLFIQISNEPEFYEGPTCILRACTSSNTDFATGQLVALVEAHCDDDACVVEALTQAPKGSLALRLIPSWLGPLTLHVTARRADGAIVQDHHEFVSFTPKLSTRVSVNGLVLPRAHPWGVLANSTVRFDVFAVREDDATQELSFDSSYRVTSPGLEGGEQGRGKTFTVQPTSRGQIQVVSTAGALEDRFEVPVRSVADFTRFELRPTGMNVDLTGLARVGTTDSVELTVGQAHQFVLTGVDAEGHLFLGGAEKVSLSDGAVVTWGDTTELFEGVPQPTVRRAHTEVLAPDARAVGEATLTADAGSLVTSWRIRVSAR